MANTSEMPPQWRKQAEGEPRLRARVVADYVAGMTDRFAENEYKRLFGGDANL
jgi:dGTPase